MNAALALVASLLSGVAAVWAAWAGLRKARRHARRLCDEELDACRERLAAARREAEAVAATLHDERMRAVE